MNPRPVAVPISQVADPWTPTLRWSVERGNEMLVAMNPDRSALITMPGRLAAEAK